MKRIDLGVICILLILCCGSVHAQTPSIKLSFDFRDGALGWQPGFADYPPEHNLNDQYELRAEIRQLPTNIGTGTGFFFQGANRSDDLFMFLKRRLTQADGIIPGQRYELDYTLRFASSACSDCVGIGGGPGTSVFMKAGAAPIEPIPYGFNQRMNVDIGSQSQSGIATSVAGNIANGLAYSLDPPFVSLTLTHRHTTQVTAPASGELWLLVGTDSGFEGKTQLFYQQIDVTLVPVGSSPPPSTPAPKLLSEENTGRAIALNAVNLTREPFAAFTRPNFSSFTEQTRVVLIATDLELLPGENASAVSAQIEDSQQRVIQVPVEFVGKVPNFDQFTQIVVALPFPISKDGTKISISLRGSSSNAVPLAYKP